MHVFGTEADGAYEVAEFIDAAAALLVPAVVL